MEPRTSRNATYINPGSHRFSSFQRKLVPAVLLPTSLARRPALVFLSLFNSIYFLILVLFALGLYILSISSPIFLHNSVLSCDSPPSFVLLPKQNASRLCVPNARGHNIPTHFRKYHLILNVPFTKHKVLKGQVLYQDGTKNDPTSHFSSVYTQVYVGITDSNIPYISFCVSDIYVMMADLDSRKMLQCITKDYCTRSICCVWSEN